MEPVSHLRPNPALPDFPVGYHQFTTHPHLNFELNRCFNGVGQECFDDLVQAGKHITNFKTFIAQMLTLALDAERAAQFHRASMYYRFAEFFMDPADPQKQRVYDLFRSLFNQAWPQVDATRFLVPYASGFLPGWHLKAVGKPKAVLLVCGGFDSFLEEIYIYLAYCQNAGFEIYAFEGPGQGAALKDYHLPMTHEWEKPVKAVLDHFQLQDVTMFGISLGGYLASRAAAFEPRITRLVAFDVMYDFFAAAVNTQPAAVRQALRLAIRLRAKAVVNMLVRATMKLDFLTNWGAVHGMYVFQVKTPFDFFAAIAKMSLHGIADRIHQDSVLVAGASDHMVPLWMLERQQREMINAKSIRTRVFTDAEHAGSHCQVGNMKLALDYLISQVQP